MNREWTGSVAVLPDSMAALAIEMSNLATNRNAPMDESDAREMADFLRDHAYTLAEWSDAIRELYARLDEPKGEIPTNAQAIALGNFLRGHFRSDDVSSRYANVSRGGAGLGDSYLHVRFGDGYEGGIDPEGRTST